MQFFEKDSVTVIREKGNEYMREDIMTNAVLTGTRLTAEANRANVIARLRRDPSVFLVLEAKDGICDESASHPSGFCFHVNINELVPSASLRVTYKDTIAYNETFSINPDSEEDDNNLLVDVAATIIDLLSCITEEDYSFVSEDCPFFKRVELGDPISLREAGRLLERNGFQTERISTVAWASEPYLFVHENEVVLLGSRHFDGESLYLEMKRFFLGVNRDVVENAIKKTSAEARGVSVIRWEDGSWSFREEFDEDVDEGNFMDKLYEILTELKSFINRIEDEDGVGCEPWSITTQQRHFFIYETLDMSQKLSKLNV